MLDSLDRTVWLVSLASLPDPLRATVQKALINRSKCELRWAVISQ